MQTYWTNDHFEEWYRGKDFTSGPIETGNREAVPFTPETHAKVNAKTADKNSSAEEKDTDVDPWMEQIKEFIRRIDINSL